MTADLARPFRTVELPALVVCHCPYCGREVHEGQRLRYPKEAVHKHVPVYRCRCNMIFGEPVASYAGLSLKGASL